MKSVIQRFLVIALWIMFALPCCSQALFRAIELAKAGDPGPLRARVDSLTRFEEGNRTNREVIPGVWEKSDDLLALREGVEGLGQYSIELISEKGSSIYCLVLDRSTGEYVEGETVWDRDTVLFLRDTARLREVAARYLNLYDRSLEITELFCDTVRFGKLCGRAARLTSVRKRMETMVQSGHSESFDEWLTSPNVELQLYAVEGLFRMRWMGVHLSKHQRKCIRLIRAKKGMAHVCHSDVHDIRPIKDVFRAIPR